MRLRRYEFGISRGDGHVVEVYARQSNGRLFLKEFAADTVGLLKVAEAEFLADSTTWRRVEAHPDARGLSLVWTERARLHVSGEAAITAAALADANASLIVSLNKIKPRTREEIGRYLAHNTSAKHVDAPMLDVLPKHQKEEGRRNAVYALAEATEALSTGKTIVVHCLMGIHRSVSLAAVALHRAGLSESPRDAFLTIQGRRHVASWIPETVNWLSDFPLPSISS